MIRGTTAIYAIFGTPLHRVRAPTLFSAWFERVGADAVLVPMEVESEYPSFVRQFFKAANVAGAIVTFPHKRSIEVLDDWSPRVQVAQACNVIVKRPDGRLFGDIVDGVGFALGLKRAGFRFEGARCLLVGSGGAGAAIAAALVSEGVAYLGVSSRSKESAAAVAGRLREYAGDSAARIEVAANDPKGHDLVVNATPLGMHEGGPLPVDITRAASGTMVADVVMGEETPLLRAAAARGCRTHAGTWMLFEQAPTVLELWGFGSVARSEIEQVTDALGWTGNASPAPLRTGSRTPEIPIAPR